VARWLLPIGFAVALWQLGAADRAPPASRAAPIPSSDEAPHALLLDGPRVVHPPDAHPIDAPDQCAGALASADAPKEHRPVARAPSDHTGPPIYLLDVSLLI